MLYCRRRLSSTALRGRPVIGRSPVASYEAYPYNGAWRRSLQKLGAATPAEIVPGNVCRRLRFSVTWGSSFFATLRRHFTIMIPDDFHCARAENAKFQYNAYSAQRSTIGDLAFFVAAPRVWNSLSSSVTTSETLGIFRRRAEDTSFRCFTFTVLNCAAPVFIFIL